MKIIDLLFIAILFAVIVFIATHNLPSVKQMEQILEQQERNTFDNIHVIDNGFRLSIKKVGFLLPNTTNVFTDDEWPPLNYHSLSRKMKKWPKQSSYLTMYAMLFMGENGKKFLRSMKKAEVFDAICREATLKNWIDIKIYTKERWWKIIYHQIL